jgi:sec-independent protein translocase protein TatB
MLDVGWTELLVIGIVALIFIGPKELPTVLRTVGQWMGKIRRMASEFQGQFQEAMREAEMEDLKKHVDSMAQGFDPLESVRKEVEAATDYNPNSGPEVVDEVTPDPHAASTAHATAVADTAEASAAPTESAPADGGRAASDVKEAGERAA